MLDPLAVFLGNAIRERGLTPIARPLNSPHNTPHLKGSCRT